MLWACEKSQLCLSLRCSHLFNSGVFSRFQLGPHPPSQMWPLCSSRSEMCWWVLLLLEDDLGFEGVCADLKNVVIVLRFAQEQANPWPAEFRTAITGHMKMLATIIYVLKMLSGRSRAWSSECENSPEQCCKSLYTSYLACLLIGTTQKAQQKNAPVPVSAEKLSCIPVSLNGRHED